MVLPLGEGWMKKERIAGRKRASIKTKEKERDDD